MRISYFFFILFFFNFFYGVDSVSLFPLFLIDKVPLRYFYHNFKDPEKRALFKNDIMINPYGSYRYKDYYNQFVSIDTVYSVINIEKNKKSTFDVKAEHNINGYSNICVFGANIFIKESPFYFAIDVPFTKSHEEINLLKIDYKNIQGNQDINDKDISVLLDNMVLKPNDQLTMQNIDIVFGSDQWPGKYLDIGYYFLITTPNIIGPALCMDYKYYQDDLQSFNIHFESVFQYMSQEKFNKTYFINEFDYYKLETNTSGVFYTESMLNLLYRFKRHSFNIGFSLVTQSSHRSLDALHQNYNNSTFFSSDEQKKHSIQALHVLYGGYLYRYNDIMCNIQLSVDRSSEKKYTPSFWDCLFVLGYYF